MNKICADIIYLKVSYAVRYFYLIIQLPWKLFITTIKIVQDFECQLMVVMHNQKLASLLIYSLMPLKLLDQQMQIKLCLQCVR